MARHIFLTGNIQVGKSTLIRRVLSAHPDYSVGGFRTVTRYGDLPNAKGGVYILPGSAPFTGWENLCNDRNRVGVRLEGSRPTAYPDVFDRLGPDLLRPRRYDLLLMDELGRMEQTSEIFCQGVLRALNGHTPVLGVIQPRAQMLYDAISAHPEAALLTVTSENREELLPHLDALLTQAIDESRRYYAGNSSGAAVFRGEEVLLIRSGRRWSFPKGHIEVGESEEEAAVREVREESGAAARLLPSLRMEMPSAHAGDTRRIIGFAAIYAGGELTPQPGETDEAVFLPVEEALSRMRFDADRRFIRAAYAHYKASL